MVTKKSIFATIILLFYCCVSIYGQNTTNNDISQKSESITVSSAFDENSTDYFNTATTNTVSNETTRNTSSLWLFVRMVIVLLIVCGLIYLVFWFIKNKTKIVNTENEYLRRAAFINIGQNKSIEVITLIDKGYLIGVTEDNITLLGEIDDKELIQSMNITADEKQNVKNPVNFNEVLDMFLKKNRKSGTAFNSAENNMDKLINNLENNSTEQES